MKKILLIMMAGLIFASCKKENQLIPQVQSYNCNDSVNITLKVKRISSDSMTEISDSYVLVAKNDSDSSSYTTINPRFLNYYGKFDSISYKFKIPRNRSWEYSVSILTDYEFKYYVNGIIQKDTIIHPGNIDPWFIKNKGCTTNLIQVSH
jgi:hypothetical protein